MRAYYTWTSLNILEYNKCGLNLSGSQSPWLGSVITTELFLRFQIKNFLGNVVRELWVQSFFYVNPEGPKEPPLKLQNSDVHQKRVTICCWMLYHEFREAGISVTAIIYAVRQQSLSEATQRKQPRGRKVYFLDGNARPRIAMTSRQRF